MRKRIEGKEESVMHRLRELGVWFGQGYLDTRAQGTLDGFHVVLLQEQDRMWLQVVEGY
jgi:hypothetical protein